MNLCVHPPLESLMPFYCYSRLRMATPVELMKRSWSRRIPHLNSVIYKEKFAVFDNPDKDDGQLTQYLNERRVRTKASHAKGK